MSVCDNKSVGIIVRQDNAILLIERKNFPPGFAPPAGHVDDHGGEQNAAKAELSEEVGLTVVELRPVIEDLRKENSCKREGGDYHHWWVYEAEATGELKASQDETKQAGWFTLDDIRELALRTEAYKRGEIGEDEWNEKPGLEPVWYDHFKDLDIL